MDFASAHDISKVVKEEGVSRAIKNTTYCTNCVFAVRPSVSSDCGTEVQDASRDTMTTSKCNGNGVAGVGVGREEKREEEEECFQSARGPGLKLIPWA